MAANEEDDLVARFRGAMGTSPPMGAAPAPPQPSSSSSSQLPGAGTARGDATAGLKRNESGVDIEEEALLRIVMDARGAGREDDDDAEHASAGSPAGVASGTTSQGQSQKASPATGPSSAPRPKPGGSDAPFTVEGAFGAGGEPAAAFGGPTAAVWGGSFTAPPPHNTPAGGAVSAGASMTSNLWGGSFTQVPTNTPAVNHAPQPQSHTTPQQQGQSPNQVGGMSPFSAGAPAFYPGHGYGANAHGHGMPPLPPPPPLAPAVMLVRNSHGVFLMQAGGSPLGSGTPAAPQYQPQGYGSGPQAGGSSWHHGGGGGFASSFRSNRSPHMTSAPPPPAYGSSGAGREGGSPPPQLPPPLAGADAQAQTFLPAGEPMFVRKPSAAPHSGASSPP